MFDIFFGWPKASKCKKVIKRTRCRLKLLKNKRQAIVRQSREDVAELLKSGYQETAVNRVEQLIKDENLTAAYELLDHFCEFIITQLPYIRRHKDCPNDINEAVSSLIYASARFGDLPELCVVRKLFGKRYGEKFAATAVELFPGNLVNNQLKEFLSEKPVPDGVKYRVVDEIARDYCLQPELLAIEYYPDWQLEQVKETKGYQVEEEDAQINDRIAGSDMHASEVAEIARDLICVDSSIKNFLFKASDSCSLRESNIANTAMVSTVQQYPPYIQSFPLQKKVEKVENFARLQYFTTSGLEDKGERMALATSAESKSLPLYPEEMVEYVNDIEECQFSVSKDEASQDQRLFFRSSDLPRREKTELGCAQSDTDQDESEIEKLSTRSSRKSKRVPDKRSRRRSVSLENQGIMDIGCMVYYHKPSRSPSAHKSASHYRGKHQKPIVEGIPQSSFAQKRLKQHSYSEMERNLQSCQSEDGTKRSSLDVKLNGCSLDHPCYFCVYDDKDCLEALPVKPKRGIRAIHIEQKVLFGECHHCQVPFWKEELNKGVELVTIPQRPNRRSYSGAAVYNVFTYPDSPNENQKKEIKARNSESMSGFSSYNASHSRTNDSLEKKETPEPYSRAVTMPPERQKYCTDKMVRTYSYPEYPNHVHPKLPDYNDIAAKFTALKRERLENKDYCGDIQLK